MSVEQTIKVAQQVIPRLADTLASFGGHLECQNCCYTEKLGDVKARLSGGWPECCGYTMRWVTAHQLAERGR